MHKSSPAGLSGLCKITEHLFLSNASAANDAHQLSHHNIECIINISEKKPSPGPPPGVEYIHIPLSDSPDSDLRSHFDAVADKAHAYARLRKRALVHCNAGVSRSVTLCMVYLVKHGDMSLQEAHTWVRKRRPIARPNVGFWRQMIQYEVELRGGASVRMVPSPMGEVPDVYEEETRNMTPL